MKHGFYAPPLALLNHLTGRYSFEENGRPVGLGSSFPIRTLVGFQLVLPRILAPHDVMLSLSLGDESCFLPLRLLGKEKGEERYAVLLPPSLGNERASYALSVTFSSPFGMLSARRTASGKLSFFTDLLEESGFPPLSFGDVVPPSGRDFSDALFSYLTKGTRASLLQELRGILPALSPTGSAAYFAGGGEYERRLRARLLAEGFSPAVALAYGRAAILITALLGGRMPSEDDGEADLLLARRHIGEILKKESLFFAARAELFLLTEELLAIGRRREGETLLLLFNRSSQPMQISSDEEFSVLLGGRGRKGRFPLSPYSALLLRVPLWRENGAGLHIAALTELPKKRTPPPIRRPRAATPEKPPCVQETVIRTVIDF